MKLSRILLPLLILIIIAVGILLVFLTWGESTAPDALAVHESTARIAISYFDASLDSAVIDVFDATGTRLFTIEPKYKETAITVVHFDESGNMRFFLPIEGHYYTVNAYGDILSYHTADRVDGTAYAYTRLWTQSGMTYRQTADSVTFTYTATDIGDRMRGRRDTVTVRDDTGKEIMLWIGDD